MPTGGQGWCEGSSVLRSVLQSCLCPTQLPGQTLARSVGVWFELRYSVGASSPSWGHFGGNRHVGMLTGQRILIRYRISI